MIPENFKNDPQTWQFIRNHPDSCAAVTLTAAQKRSYAILALFLLFLLLYRWDVLVLLLTVFFSFWYLTAVFFRGIASLTAFRKNSEKSAAKTLAVLRDDELPVYTILLPIYHEPEVVSKLLRNVGQLDYPKEKLEVLLLLEHDDAETSRVLAGEELPSWCRIINVPDGPLRTKPRACNYGLAEAAGEFCVIYDAEDAPETDQLKKALLAFQSDRSGKLICAQAKLNFYNANENWLTRFFTVEYTTYFDLTLAGCQKFGLPLPLGGTSNHFRTDLLRKVGPWDPFNVTEDCDLGVRIYEAGYRTNLIDSTTYEEANCRPGNWLRQRSRWVKGFLQTHFVHCRTPFSMIRRLGWYGAAGAYLAIGGSALMMLVNPFFWGMLLLYLTLLICGCHQGKTIAEQLIGPHPPPPFAGFGEIPAEIQAWPLLYRGPDEHWFWAGFSQISCVCSIILLLANFLFIAIGIAGVLKRKNYSLLPAALAMPCYWLLISLGAWKGFLQLFTKPFYWEKTRHGISKKQGDKK